MNTKIDLSTECYKVSHNLLNYIQNIQISVLWYRFDMTMWVKQSIIITDANTL